MQSKALEKPELIKKLVADLNRNLSGKVRVGNISEEDSSWQIEIMTEGKWMPVWFSLVILHEGDKIVTVCHFLNFMYAFQITEMSLFSEITENKIDGFLRVFSQTQKKLLVHQLK
jgi:hypothetical protein